MDDVISLGIGEPDFVSPTPVIEAAVQSLYDGKTGELVSLMQADYLGQMRTGAARAVVSLGRATETRAGRRSLTAQLSAPALACLRRMLAGEQVTQETSGMSGREWREFREVTGHS